MNKIINFNYISIFFLALIYLFPFYFGQFENFEGWNTALFSNKIFAENLRKFHYTYWVDSVGFGSPFPFNPNQLFHPIILFFLFFETNTVMFLFYFFHLFMACLFLYYLCVDLEINKKIIYVCIITYLGCSTTADFILLKFLPSEFFVWSMIPVLLFFCNKILIIKIKQEIFKNSIIIGLLVGFVILNSHPPFAINFFLIILVFFSFNLISSIKIYKYLILSSIIALIISFPKIYMIYNEFLYFNNESNKELLKRNAGRLTLNPGWFKYQLPHSLFLKPIFLPNFKEQYNLFITSGLNEALKSLSFDKIINGLLEGFFHRYFGAGLRDRGVFLGPPFVFMIIIIPFYALSIKLKNNNLYIYFFLSLIFIFIFFYAPDIIIYLIGRDIFLRDGFFIFGILAVGLFLSHLIQHSKFKILVNIIIFLQLSSIILVYIPIWTKNINTYRLFEKPDPEFTSYRKEWNNSYIKEIFLNEGLDLKGRIYFTRNAGHNLPNIYAHTHYNTLAYHGLRQINGETKGISQLNLYPSHQIMGGYIMGEDVLITHPKTVSFLGIRYIFHDDFINNKNFKLIKKIISNNNSYYLYENLNVFKEVLIIKPASIYNVTNIENCSHNKILCKNFDQIEVINSGFINNIKKDNGKITIEFSNTFKEGVIFISEKYRPEWRLISNNNEKNKIFKIFDGFIGIQIKDANEIITLEYRPYILIFFNFLTFFLILIIFIYFLISKNKKLN